jgi:hypothetical protein
MKGKVQETKKNVSTLSDEGSEAGEMNLIAEAKIMD